MKRHSARILLAICAVSAPTLVLAGTIAGQRPHMPRELAPHLAIYDLKLRDSKPASGINSFSGRLVFRAEGSSCSGYTTTTRFVGEVFSDQGSVITDARSSTFESPGGERFDFSTERYSDHELVDETEGAAKRTEGGARVTLERPDKTEFDIPPGTLFPSEHMREILDAAAAGRHILAAPVYDGSETGRIVYQTTTAIGEKREPMPAAQAADVAGSGSGSLSSWASWPVTIAYFDPSSATPELPSYEFTYDLFGNGISRAIRLDYGDFVLEGDLVSLDLGDAPACDL